MSRVSKKRVGSSGFSGGGSGGGGIENWNPLTQPTLLKSGKNPLRKSYTIVGNPTITALDDIGIGVSIGRIITFDFERKKWFVASKTETENLYTTPSEVQTYAELIATFPNPIDYKGKYCKVLATNTYWEVKLQGLDWIWSDTGKGAVDGYSQTAIDGFLAQKVDKETGKGLSTNDLTNALLDKLNNAPSNINSVLEEMNAASASGFQGVYDTIGSITLESTRITDFEEATQDVVGGMFEDTSTIDGTYNDATNKFTLNLKDNSVGNNHITSGAGIEVSKCKQSVITPVLSTPQNNDTQEQINNKLVGLSNNLQSQIDSRPIGATNGNVYYLTSQSSSIANYELLSFSPDPSPLDIESITINSTTAKASRLIHSYIANNDIGATIVNGGNWLFNLYGYVSHLNSSRFEIDVLKRVGTTETLLFTCETTDFSQISQVSPELNNVNVESFQLESSCNTTDKIVIKVYAKTDRTQDTTITLLHSGNQYASHIHTPLITSHNNISGTQGGDSTGKFHLNLQEYNNVQALPSNLDLKQNITDNTLNTTAKTIVGAINEVKASNDLKADQSNTYTIAQINTAFNEKVDKETGKSLISDNEITRLGTMETGAEKNINANWDSTSGASQILNKPAFKSASLKDFGYGVDNLPINGSILSPYQIVETDANANLKTSAKNSGYNLPLGNVAGTLVEGGTVYTKAQSDTSLSNLQNAIGLDIINLQNAVALKYNTADLIDSGTGLIKTTLLDPLYKPEYKLVANQTARFALTKNDVQNGDTVQQIDTQALYLVIDDTNLSNANGYSLNIAVALPDDLFRKGIDNTDDITVGNAKFVTANEKTNLETITGSSANGFVKVSNGVASLQTLIQNSELGTGINVNKLADGTVANEEFQTLDGIDITKTIQAQINELKAKAIQKRYVSPGTQGYGSDSYDGKSEATPFATLTKLNSSVASGGIDGSGFLVVHLPSQGTESVTFTQANIAIVGEAKRDFCGTTGTITANPASSSQVYQTLSIGTFVKSGAFYVILDGVTAKTALSHTGTGSLDMIDCDFATVPLSLTAAGTTRLYNCRGGVPTLNNASAFLFVGGNESLAAPTITAGFMFLKDCIISGTITLNGGRLKMQRCTVVVAQGTTLTLGASGTTLILDNVEFTYPDGTPAKIDVPSGVFFSFSGVNIYKDTSTLNGTDLSSTNSNYLRYVKINTANFPNATASTIASFDANKNLISLSTAQYPSLAELACVKGGTSSFQTQIDAKASDSLVAHLAGDETFTGVKTFASAPIFSSLTGSRKLELDANKNLISVVKTGSILNEELANSSITIAGTSTALGGSITLKTILGLDTTAGLLKYNADGTTSLAIGGTDFTLVNDPRLGTIAIDETQKANGKVLTYNSTTNTLEYRSQLVSTTNLSISNITSTSLDINSSTGTDITVTEATITTAGLFSASDKTKLNAITGTNTGDQDLSGFLTKADNLNSVLNKQTSLNNLFNVGGSVDNGKVPTVVNGDLVLAPAGAGTGNVSANGISGATGKALISLNDSLTEVGLISTVAQKQSFANSTDGMLCLSTTERDSLSWVNDDIIYNTTYHRVEKYNGTSWVSTDGTIGMFAYFDSHNAPLHFLECDNAQVSRTGVYSELWTLNTSPNPSLTPSVFTITIATPAVITKTAHGLTHSQRVRFTTTGALPTGITTGVDYIVTVLTVNTFVISTTPQNAFAGTYIATSGTQSGTHSYTNTLYGQGNGINTQNAPDRRGAFLRGTDLSRLINSDIFSDNGSLQGDAIRNIIGKVNIGFENSPSTTGALNAINKTGDGTSGGGNGFYDIIFDASRVVPTADENRPKSYSSTIYIKIL